MIFILSALWWIKIRGLWKLPDRTDWLWGKLGLVLNPVFCNGWGCVSSLLFDLRPNYLVEVMKKMVTPSKGPMHSLLHSVPPTLQQATSGPHLHWDSWTLRGKSGSVSCGVTALLSWVLVHIRFCLCLPRICFPSPAHSPCGSVVGLMVTSFKIAYATPRCAVPRAPAPMSGYCWPIPSLETLKHSKASLPQTLWGLLVCTRFCLSPLSISGRYQVWVWQESV